MWRVPPAGCDNQRGCERAVAAWGRITVDPPPRPGDLPTAVVLVPVQWAEVPYAAELHVGLALVAEQNARVAAPTTQKGDAEQVAAFVFGVPPDTCPPGELRWGGGAREGRSHGGQSLLQPPL